MAPFDAPWRPLGGIRIVEFAPYLPGPYAGALLADLGASVIKIEPPSGDPARALQKSLYTSNNRGKRSLCLDLKQAAAQAVAHRLVARADAVIEGHKPGVAAKLGMDYAILSAQQPALVYLALSGFGQHGPNAMLPGHDINYLAAGGALALSGHWHGSPRRSGLPLADQAGALHGALALLAAVMEARTTGRGRFLDLSLTAAALRMAAARGTDQAPRAHLHPTNDLFLTADAATVAVGLIEDHFYARFVSALRDRWPDLAVADFGNVALRRQNGDRLHDLLARIFESAPLEYWLELAQQHALPLSALLTPAQALAEHYPELPAPPFPVKTSAPSPVQADAPDIGADTLPVLQELGYGAGEISALLAAGSALTHEKQTSGDIS